MNTVVFVDDEISILEGLRRNLRRMRSEWDMHFFSEPEKALEFIKNTPVAAVVSDMRMPGMNGAELLCAVQNCSPGTVRLALSGYADSQLILESLHVIHRYISKPVELEVVRDAVLSSLALRERLDNAALDAYVGSMGALPTLPSVYHRITQMVGAEDFCLADIALVVEQDVGLSATVLKIVNSSFFGHFGTVETVARSVSMLGADTIKNIVLTEALVKQFDQTDSAALEALNLRAKLVSALASRFAKAAALEQKTVDHSQLAGMVCTLGDMIVMDRGRCKDGSDEIAPPILASYLLSLWSLPDPIVEAVLNHRDPIDLSSERGQPVSPSDCVRAAWYATEHYIDVEPAAREEGEQALRETLAYLASDESVANAWIEQTVDVANPVELS